MNPQAVADCAVALKEWATVLEAMARGEQLVLIRKGGLIEPGSGFEILSPSFVFYPTFEHQAVSYLREPYRGYFEEASRKRAAEGQVAFALFGQVVYSMQSEDPQVVKRLEPFHIYNDVFLSQRLKWQPQQPLMIIIVRAFKLSSPKTVAVSPEYAGCKSWVQLNAPVALGLLEPVVDDAVFEQRRRKIEAVLN